MVVSSVLESTAEFRNSKKPVDEEAQGATKEQVSLVLVARAIAPLLESPEPSDSDYATALCELIQAVTDRDDSDEDNVALDDEEASDLWKDIKTSLDDEYNRPEGGFARLMHGGTKTESRRMIQLAFNRPNGFPRVLVAQSLVGREGLNLYKAFRIVVLLHPEWNPGVVEQEIGRVDRVGSHWSRQLKDAIDKKKPANQLPRIEIRSPTPIKKPAVATSVTGCNTAPLVEKLYPPLNRR